MRSAAAPEPRARRALARTAVALVGLALGAAAVEGIARAVLGSPVSGVSRALFFSDPSWRLWDDGTIRYAPGVEIRSAAVYGDRIEYDVRFVTNDMGLVDDRDYGVHTDAVEGDAAEDAVDLERVALVGDSFTAGFHGGDPWVPALAARVARERPGVVLYNLGVGGTGVVQFADLAIALDGLIGFDRVVLLGISADLRRPAFRPLEGDGRIHLCRAELTDDACRERSEPLYTMERNAGADWILELAALNSASSNDQSAWAWARASASESMSGWASRLGRRTHVGAALLELWAPRRSAVDDRPLPDSAREALTRLARHFEGRRLEWLQIPQKAEVSSGSLDIDPSPLLRELGIRHRSLLGRCPLTPRDFHRRDPHPNQRGYTALALCVARELGLGDPPAASSLRD